LDSNRISGKKLNKLWKRENRPCASSERRTMKKEVLILITDNYADWEIGYIAPLLNNPSRSHMIKTVSIEEKTIISQGGLKVIPDYTIGNLPEKFEMLILVGGTFWSEKRFRLPQVKMVIDYCIENDIVIAAICDGATFLAENGYLDSVPHTGNSLQHLKANAPRYKGESYFKEEQCVACKSIVTANGTATLEFSREILKLLDIKLPVGILEWYSCYKYGEF
jgi:putative intracellular protease/amidase